MIGHHAQAVEMVALVPARTASEDVKKLALRIDLSQQDEIKMMQRWLEVRGQRLPDPHAHQMSGATLMPGMLTGDEMAQLVAAKGAEFDRLFLEGMMKHHGGAITMTEINDFDYGAAPGRRHREPPPRKCRSLNDWVEEWRTFCAVALQPCDLDSL